MEKSIVTTGKTIDLAIEAALSQLGLDRDSVSVQVLQQAKAGFLGFGAQPAKVQVTYEVADPTPAPQAPRALLALLPVPSPSPLPLLPKSLRLPRRKLPRQKHRRLLPRLSLRQKPPSPSPVSPVPKLPRLPKSRRFSLLPSPALLRKRLRSSSPDCCGIWALRLFLMPSRVRTIHTMWNWWAKTLAT